MSKRPPSQPVSSTRRGAPEVVAKRRAARLFNDVLLGRRPAANDGRTERKRRRLLDELASGTSRSGRALTPIDVLTRVQELLELGAALAEIRRACPPPAAPQVTPELVERLRLLQEAYGFMPEVYAFIGLRGATLRKAGIAQSRTPGRRGAA